MREKVKVLERGSDMVLAAHVTPLGGRWQAVTVEWAGARNATPTPDWETTSLA